MSYPEKETLVALVTVERGLILANVGGAWVRNLTPKEMRALKSTLRGLPGMLDDAWAAGQQRQVTPAEAEAEPRTEVDKLEETLHDLRQKMEQATGGAVVSTEGAANGPA